MDEQQEVGLNRLNVVIYQFQRKGELTRDLVSYIQRKLDDRGAVGR